MDFSSKNWFKVFADFYGNDENEIVRQQKRYQNLFDNFIHRFGKGKIEIFSTPGRTELSGNHTDHNRGKVLAGAINLDSIAVAKKNNESMVRLKSDAFTEEFVVELTNLSPIENEKGTTSAIIRGIAARFSELGYKIGGFDTMMTSDVLVGSGLSSSASVEVLVGTMFNYFFNENRIPPADIAKICQFAENNFFGKPCGLMDQTACAVGGIVAIDFKDAANPIIEKIEFDFEEFGYSLLVVDTGGNHADLTGHYSAIPEEMKAAAAILGKKFAREISKDEFFKNISDIRTGAGDRAALRVYHFLKENERVSRQVNALREKKILDFLKYVNLSGNSSNKWLQNSYPIDNFKEQGINLALALTEDFIETLGKGACRVHGGGFAGTILVFLPKEAVEQYKSFIEPIFGENCLKKLRIRALGTVHLQNFE